MPDRSIRVEYGAQAGRYDITVGKGLLANTGARARGSLGSAAQRILIVSNPTVFELYGRPVERSLGAAGFKTAVWLMKDGERYKNMRSFEELLRAISKERLSRDDALLALGGGVVGDLAGFAASVYLRGIKLVQVPTTLLAMIDSSVGGKTGVNSASGKNLIGAFHQPSGVLADIETLATLPPREITAGLCEAVKQAILSGKKLFRHTDDFLRDGLSKDLRRKPLDPRFAGRLGDLIAEQIEFKAAIVRGDEKEETRRVDARSRKILNFGHTFGHSLEKVTKYRRFRHGEAVGYGILAAAELSKILEILPVDVVKLLNDVVHRTGRLPAIPDIDPKHIIEALEFDKKSSLGSVQWVLLRDIGKPVIVKGDDIPRRAVLQAVKATLRNRVS